MPASRWHSNLNELFQWIGADDELLTMIMPPLFAQFNKKDSNSSSSDSEETTNTKKIS
jgi:hypothetical protein